MNPSGLRPVPKRLCSVIAALVMLAGFALTARRAPHAESGKAHDHWVSTWGTASFVRPQGQQAPLNFNNQTPWRERSISTCSNMAE
jgi:hypothetical protein